MDDNYQVLIVGAGILIIPGDESPEVYGDVLDSILLAQLVANKNSEKSSARNWYDVYVSVLDDFWLRQQRTKQTWQINNSMSQSALTFFSTGLSNDAWPDTAIIGDVLARAARICGDDPALQKLRSAMKRPVALDTPSASSGVVHLLVVVAHSPTSFSSGFIEFTAQVELSQNPFQQTYQPEDIQGLVQVRHARATLAEMRYSGVREAIARKVRDKVADNVTLLNLPKEISA